MERQKDGGEMKKGDSGDKEWKRMDKEKIRNAVRIGLKMIYIHT